MVKMHLMHQLLWLHRELNKLDLCLLILHLQIMLDLFNADERLVAGNTSDLTGTHNKDQNWVRLKIRSEQYFGSGKFKYGYLFEGVVSNQSTGINLTGSLINAPSFEPLVDSKTLFLENFKAYNYMAGGIRNVFNVGRKIDLRLEAYFFKPFEELTTSQDDDSVVLNDATSVYYSGTAAAVYHSLLGPISLQVNYYDDDENQWGVLMHIGYVLFNKKPMD